MLPAKFFYYSEVSTAVTSVLDRSRPVFSSTSFGLKRSGERPVSCVVVTVQICTSLSNRTVGAEGQWGVKQGQLLVALPSSVAPPMLCEQQLLSLRWENRGPEVWILAGQSGHQVGTSHEQNPSLRHPSPSSFLPTHFHSTTHLITLDTMPIPHWALLTALFIDSAAGQRPAPRVRRYASSSGRFHVLLLFFDYKCSGIYKPLKPRSVRGRSAAHQDVFQGGSLLMKESRRMTWTLSTPLLPLQARCT